MMRRLDFWMRQAGLDAESLRAAAARQSAALIEGAPDHAPLEEQVDRALAQSGREEPSAPMLTNGAPSGAIETGTAEQGGDHAQPSVAVEVVKEPTRQLPRVVLVSTGMRRVNRPNGFPRPVLRSPVFIVIDGGPHAASPASSA